MTNLFPILFIHRRRFSDWTEVENRINNVNEYINILYSNPDIFKYSCSPKGFIKLEPNGKPIVWTEETFK